MTPSRDRVELIRATSERGEYRFLLKTIDELRAALDQVDAVLMVNHVGPRKDNDYRKALHDLVTFNLHLEHPSVAEAATKRQQELDRLREDARRNQDRLAWLLDDCQMTTKQLDESIEATKEGNATR